MREVLRNSVISGRWYLLFCFSFSVVTGVDCGDELQNAQFLGSGAQLSLRVLCGGSQGQDEGVTCRANGGGWNGQWEEKGDVDASAWWNHEDHDVMLLLKVNVAQHEPSMIQFVFSLQLFSCAWVHTCYCSLSHFRLFFSCRLLTPRWRPCVKRQRHGFVSLDNVDMIFVGMVP